MGDLPLSPGLEPPLVPPCRLYSVACTASLFLSPKLSRGLPACQVKVAPSPNGAQTRRPGRGPAIPLRVGPITGSQPRASPSPSPVRARLARSGKEPRGKGSARLGAPPRAGRCVHRGPEPDSPRLKGGGGEGGTRSRPWTRRAGEPGPPLRPAGFERSFWANGRRGDAPRLVQALC